MSRRVDAALGFVLLRSVRNRLLRQVRRLREVRYLLGMLFIGAYFWWLFFREGAVGVLSGGGRGGAILAAAGAVGLLLLVGYWWVVGVNRSALAFSPAEVHFFFPGPLRRGDLVRLKLLGLQPTLLVTAPLWALLGGGGWPRLPLQAVGIWLLLTLVMMHRMGVALARVRAGQRGTDPAPWVRPALFWGAVLALLTWSAAAAWRPPPAGGGPAAYLAAGLAVLDHPVAATLLWPFRMALVPALAPEPSLWLRGAAVVVALLVLHYLWVTRTTAAFEETSLGASAERAQRVAAVRAGKPLGLPRGGAAFRLPLPARGHPAGAIAWKNMVAATAHFRPATLLVYGLLAALVVFVLPRLIGEEARIIVAMLTLYGIGMVTLVAPVTTRNDLRGDLPRTEVRTYPLSGPALVAAEMAAVTVLFAAIQVALALLAYVVLLGSEPFGLDLAKRTALLLTAVLLLPALTALGVALQNGMALLFPAWTRFGPAAQGFEASGQRLVNTIFFALLLTLGLVVPLIVGSLVGALLYGWWGFWALPPAALAASAVLAAEVWLLILWMGGLWERTDPTAVSGL